MKRILIMGLPGAGKTYLAQHVLEHLQNNCKTVMWLNADDVRKKYNDWDFSHEGRIRQSLRMRELADSYDVDYVICDFVAPLVEMRNNFKADWTVWVDTINQGRFEDTNKVFVAPEQYDFRVTEQKSEKWGEFIAAHILDDRQRPVFDWQKETVQMLGRWQPWHEGHRKLFERALAKLVKWSFRSEIVRVGTALTRLLPIRSKTLSSVILTPCIKASMRFSLCLT
jgi:adenylylsulfate kinase